MNVGIMCGSYDELVEESKAINKEVANVIAQKGYNFVMGAGQTGSMGDIKRIAQENGRSLLVAGIKDELEKVNANIKVKVNSPIERLSVLYQKSDLIIFLSGGIGTRSEFFAFLDSKIEMKEEKTLFLYNEDHSYDFLLRDLEEAKERKSIANNYKLYFDIIMNKKELIKKLEEIDKIQKEGKR